MSDIAVGRASTDNPFKLAVVLALLGVGAIGFLGLLVLGAYAPDLRSGRNGGAHALSNAATGFAGLVKLAEATGRNPRIIRNSHDYDTEDLLILTPERGSVDISEAMDARQENPTLLILPKWQTMPDPRHGGWVSNGGTMPLDEPESVMAPAWRFNMQRHAARGWLQSQDIPTAIRFRAPSQLQVITGFAKEQKPRAKLTTLIGDGHGGTVLAQIGNRPLFVLADPDLLSNQGIKDIGQARAGLALLDWLNSNPPERLAFDVAMNGFGHSRSPLKLMFEPPFLVLTVCIGLALLLAGIQAFARFGPVAARSRAIAFGKAALVDNSAALVRRAGREARLGGRFAAMVRERAALAFGVPARLREAALDQYLDQIRGSTRFTDLVTAAEQANDRQSLLRAAQALHDWQKEKTA